jgi:hypothetical protein
LRLRAHRARLVTAELIELEIERVDQEHQRYVDIIPVRICSSTDSISSVTKVQPPLGSGCLIVPWIGERVCVAALAVLTRWLIGQRRHRGHEAVDGYTDAKTTLLMMSSVRFASPSSTSMPRDGPDGGETARAGHREDRMPAAGGR